ncbi:MAG TPA: glycoside hydrolase family 48 protein, partial [Actinospica sp.]|nr:glycoside hydrolase family 48 protein [Actinospica sp.]
MSRRQFATAAGGAFAASVFAPSLARAAGADPTATSAATDAYTQAFLTQYNKIKDPANGYFSSSGIPYHCVETLIVE